MDIFNVLSLIGGLCLFLYGMNVMGQALERSAGTKLELMLGKLTNNKFAGLLTGLGVTAVIQSSSATTVMVVGFVNSGLMTLKQSIHVIMGANVGTTVTAWILSLSGISGDSIFVKLLKPTSFTPILALLGIGLYMFSKSNKKRDIGTILLGFAVLMFGMDTMTGSVEGLKNEAWFGEMFTLFKNPLLGVLVGVLLTAIIQSSSASVGVLQALASTGKVSMGAAVPIIMGQNIGTCVTCILASFGTNKNAKRAAIVHLAFNVVGTAIWLTAYCIVNSIFPALFDFSASAPDIAVAHSIFNIGCTLLLFPLAGLLEKIAYLLVKDDKLPDSVEELDDRLLATPAVALERCNELTLVMAKIATDSLGDAVSALKCYDKELAEKIRQAEDKTDHYEDLLGSYLVKLSGHKLNEKEGARASMLLKVIGDFERIGDHAVNILESAEELVEKNIVFSGEAQQELNSLTDAMLEIISMAYIAFSEENLSIAACVEPLEEVIDRMREFLRGQHIERLRQGNCSIEAGFVWSDLITNMERVSDHCSNIAGAVIDIADNNMNIHESLKTVRGENDFYKGKYNEYYQRYFRFVNQA